MHFMIILTNAFFSQARHSLKLLKFLLTEIHLMMIHCVGRGGTLVETITFNRRVVGSTLALATM